MSLQEFNTLLEKFVERNITKEQLTRLEELASANPEYQKEYDKYRSVIIGIKSKALGEELRDIMNSEKPDDSNGL